MMRLIVSSVVSSSSPAPAAESAMLTAAEVLPPLARMRLVDDDGEAAAPLLVPDLVEDERELLHRRDDDLLAALDKPAEVTRAFGMADGGPDLGELLDGVADLLVEDAPVGDHDDGVEHPRIVLPEPVRNRESRRRPRCDPGDA